MSKNKTNKSIRYGNMPVKKYLRGGHYHVIVEENNNNYYSVGLTSDKPKNKKNQKLHKVFESNGKLARLKRNVTIDIKNHYHKRTANFNVDVDTENKALKIVENKKGKYK